MMLRMTYTLFLLLRLFGSHAVVRLDYEMPIIKECVMLGCTLPAVGKAN